MTLWALRRSGLGTRGAAGTLLTFLVLVYAVFLGSLALAGLVLTISGIGPTALTALPAALAALGMVLALAAAWWMPTEGTGRLRTAGAVLGGAVRNAVGHLRSADPRLLGAFAWWGFDMAVLYGMLNAFGTPPAFAVVVLAYFLGQVANTVPVPGAASGGLVGVLLAFGVAPDLAIVSVLTYRALAIWIPAPIGLVALGKLRRTMARWEAEDAEPVEAQAEVAAEVIRPRRWQPVPVAA
jgi:putative heme transporter